MDRPGKIANPAHVQLNKENENCISLSAFAPEHLVTPDGFDSPVPRQLAHLHTQAKSGAYGIPPEFSGGIHLCTRLTLHHLLYYVPLLPLHEASSFL